MFHLIGIAYVFFPSTVMGRMTPSDVLMISEVSSLSNSRYTLFLPFQVQHHFSGV
jgi:hypothetical protein